MSVAGEARGLTLGAPALEAARSSRRALGRVALIAAICAVPVLLYLPFLTEPFFRDEGLYAAVAQMMLDGKIPYRDAFDNKPPMVFVWYATSFVIFGEHVWAPRLLVSLLLSGSVYLMYREGRLLFSHRAGLIAALALAGSFGLATLETSANTEYFMIPPLVAALYCFSMGKETGNPRWFAGAGFLSGIAMATKHISLFVLVLYMALLAWPIVREHGVRGLWSARFRDSGGALAAGCLGAGALIIAPFAATGTLPDLYEATVVYTLEYVGAVPFTEKLGTLIDQPTFVLSVFGPFVLASALGILYIARNGANGHGPLVVGWLVANWLGIFAAGRFYDHYYATLLPPIALLAPLGFLYVRERWPAPSWRYGVIAALAILMIVPLVQNAQIYFRATPESRHAAKYADDNRTSWENDGAEFGAWLKARTRPGDGVYNFGFQSELYFYSERQSPTRFIMDRPFWTNRDYIGEALDELRADPPVYVIDSAIYEGWSQYELYTREVKAWILANYEFVGKVYYADVYVLKEHG